MADEEVTQAPAVDAAADAGTDRHALARQETQTRDEDVGASTVASPPLPDVLAQSSPTAERNQAPGILDRRKSTKPTQNRSLSRGSTRSGKRGGPPIKVTMADIGAGLRAKDGDTPGTESDAFEDAQDLTPRPSTTNPIAFDTPSTTNGHAENGDHPNGLAIQGANDIPQSTVDLKQDAPNLDLRPALPDRDSSSRLPPRATSPLKAMHGLSGDFVVSTPPPPSTAERAQALEQRSMGAMSPPPRGEGLARKASSGIAGFLGRMGSVRKTARSPPAPRQESRFAVEKRNTAGSMASLDSGVNGLPSIADTEGSDASKAKPSLQDQFRSLRQQEEISAHEANAHAVNGDEEKTPIARTASEADIQSPTIASEEDRPAAERSMSTPGLLKSPQLDPALPPGTASGLSAGPAEEPRPVNWDLWQSVVYEGPAAVQRTSGEELRDAIASGIPAAIRGVVWQVLADSKSEELEGVYRTLKAKGTAAETEQQLKPQAMSRSESQNTLNGVNGERGSISSSRSSIHSEPSTPATTGVTSPPQSLDGNGAEAQGKLLAEKQKREAAALTKLEKAIMRDMGSRTSYSKFTQSAGLQDGLFGVCKAYALFDEGVGYAQGINFIAMPLLFNMSEEEAFTLLVKLMSKYDFRSMFTVDMAGLHLRLYQFERLLEDFEPALYCHLRRRNVGPQLYATQWFLTLFAYRFPLQLVLRVYDLIFSEGLTAILKFGIVLMQRNRNALLDMKDMSHLTTFLKERIFDVYIDKSPSASSLLDSGFFGSVTGGADKELYRADELVRDACDVHISDDTLARYTAEWEESQRLERERTEEVESLRSNNALLTSRIKALEERTQQQDTEHVNIASEMVQAKIENDRLHDENEGLMMKVEELQRIADAQPAEVEARLQEEIQTIMQRNIEVQNENRMLKEEMEEMETHVVNAKMAAAQAQSESDGLRQRISNITAALHA